jgi:hypothetical protein
VWVCVGVCVCVCVCVRVGVGVGVYDADVVHELTVTCRRCVCMGAYGGVCVHLCVERGIRDCDFIYIEVSRTHPPSHPHTDPNT